MKKHHAPHAQSESAESDLALWHRLCADVRPIHPPDKVTTKQATTHDVAPRPEDITPIMQKNAPKIVLPSAEILLRPQAHNWQQKNIAVTRQERPKDFAEMDGRSNRRFRAGKMRPDAVLDLHGETEREAAISFARFFQLAVTRGHRHLLVITGKGSGVLHRSLAGWLERPEIRAHLAGVSAMPHHKGGSGAFGLYLKKNN